METNALVKDAYKKSNPTPLTPLQNVKLLKRKETPEKSLNKKTQPAEKNTVLVPLFTVEGLRRNPVLNDPSGRKNDKAPKETKSDCKKGSVEFRAPKTPLKLQEMGDENDSHIPVCQVKLMPERQLHSVTRKNLNDTKTHFEKNFEAFVHGHSNQGEPWTQPNSRMAQKWNQACMDQNQFALIDEDPTTSRDEDNWKTKYQGFK